MSLTVLYQYHQDEWYLYSITVITSVPDYCISITKMSDTCTLSQLSPMSLTTVSVSPRWVIPVLYHSYHLSLTVLYQYHQDEWYLYSITVITYVSDYCISITKMSDTCTLSQLSPMSLNTVSVSPRWVIPVLYHSYNLCLWLYCISITKMSDTCTLSQLSPMSLTTVSVSPRWVIPVLYHSYHLCLWLYCISITKMSDTCTLSQLSPMSLTTVSVSPRWVIPVLYHSYHLCLWLLYQYH